MICFIHIAHCGGRTLKSYFEKYANDTVYIHHINPCAWYQDIERNKIIRFWEMNWKSNRLLENSLPVASVSKRFCCLLRHPFDRIMCEIKDDPHLDIHDPRGHNIMCKSLKAAISGNINDYFGDITQKDYDMLLEYIQRDNIIVGVVESYGKFIHKLNTFLNISIQYVDHKPTQYDDHMADAILQYNKYDFELFKFVCCRP